MRGRSRWPGRVRRRRRFCSFVLGAHGVWDVVRTRCGWGAGARRCEGRSVSARGRRCVCCACFTCCGSSRREAAGECLPVALPRYPRHERRPVTSGGEAGRGGRSRAGDISTHAQRQAVMATCMAHMHVCESRSAGVLRRCGCGPQLRQPSARFWVAVEARFVSNRVDGMRWCTAAALRYTLGVIKQFYAAVLPMA